jgi:hypothetical protein
VFARTIGEGFLPLWDLAIGFGQPLLADPGAQVLYPTTWLTLLLAPWTVYAVLLVLRVLRESSIALSGARRAK